MEEQVIKRNGKKENMSFDKIARRTMLLGKNELNINYSSLSKKIIEIAGFFACDTHAKSVASTGVIQGEEARPKAPPITKGVIIEGTLSSINFKSGPLGNWNFKIPNKFKPIIIAIKATKDA